MGWKQQIHREGFTNLNEGLQWLGHLPEETTERGEQLHDIQQFQVVYNPSYAQWADVVVLCNHLDEEE